MKAIVLCGSSQFKTEILAFAAGLHLNHVSRVYTPIFSEINPIAIEPTVADIRVSPQKPTFDIVVLPEKPVLSYETQKAIVLGRNLDLMRKIHLADVVFVFNKDDKLDTLTNLAIGYALALGKPIYAYGADSETTRQHLYLAFVRSPEEMVRFLV